VAWYLSCGTKKEKKVARMKKNEWGKWTLILHWKNFNFQPQEKRFRDLKGSINLTLVKYKNSL